MIEDRARQEVCAEVWMEKKIRIAARKEGGDPLKKMPYAKLTTEQVEKL